MSERTTQSLGRRRGAKQQSTNPADSYIHVRSYRGKVLVCWLLPSYLAVRDPSIAAEASCGVLSVSLRKDQQPGGGGGGRDVRSRAA